MYFSLIVKKICLSDKEQPVKLEYLEFGASCDKKPKTSSNLISIKMKNLQGRFWKTFQKKKRKKKIQTTIANSNDI